MKYSFIVPIYNVEKYLNKCIDSLLAQTYKDFEIILVDDGSTDSSGRIADTYKQRYSEVMIVVHQINMGLGGARNTGISLARGEYLLMVDSDDYVSENMLQTIDGYLAQFNNDILCFDYIVEEDGSQRAQQLYGTKVSYTPITSRQFILGAPSACNKVFRASLFKSTNITFPSRIFYEDLATIFCLSLNAVNIGAIKDGLYYYVQRETSITHSKNTKRMLDICAATKMVLEYYTQQGKFEEYYVELEYLAVSHVLIAAVRRILESKYDYQQIRKLEQFVETNFPQYIDNAYVQKFIMEPGHRRERWLIERKYRIFYIEYCIRNKIKRMLRGIDSLIR